MKRSKIKQVKQFKETKQLKIVKVKAETYLEPSRASMMEIFWEYS